MSGPILYVTGTNTCVGKTTLATLLLRRAREKNIKLAALKPFCSGGREDAEQLHQLQSPGLTLDQVNPFYFHESLTPLLAARHEGKSISLQAVLETIENARAHGQPLLIEGAGGLLSPLGQYFSLRNVIEIIPGKTMVVGTNALGILNSVLLTMRALPVSATDQAVTLMRTSNPDASAKENAPLLRELLPGVSIFEIPYLSSLSPIPSLDSILDWWL